MTPNLFIHLVILHCVKVIKVPALSVLYSKNTIFTYYGFLAGIFFRGLKSMVKQIFVVMLSFLLSCAKLLLTKVFWGSQTVSNVGWALL